MDQREHYDRAEALLDAGVNVVARIGELANERYGRHDRGSGSSYERCTQQMDELGKKAMGIWAQAQVHATLSAISLPPAGRVDL